MQAASQNTDYLKVLHCGMWSVGKREMSLVVHSHLYQIKSNGIKAFIWTEGLQKQ